MRASRGAQARRRLAGGGEIVRSARASYVWLWYVLLPIACGLAPDGVEVRMTSPSGPWHRVTATPDEALDEIRATYPLQRVTLERIAARHRSRIGASS